MTSTRNNGSKKSEKQTVPSGSEPEILHPTSKWREPYCHDVLTLFDMNRTPRKVVTNPESIRIRCELSKLDKEFRCSICLDYMKNTMIVKDCLHRFCGDCIQKSIRVGKKECPSCRIHVPSRRSLISDPKFDMLICGILGEDATEMTEDGVDTPVTPQSNRNTAASSHGADNSTSRGVAATSDKPRLLTLQQAIHEKTIEKNRIEGENRDNSSGNSNNKNSSHSNKNNNNNSNNKHAKTSNKNGDLKQAGWKGKGKDQSQQRVVLELQRHPRERQVGRLSRPRIRIDGNASVSVLKVFLSRKFSHPPYEFQIYATQDGKPVLLEDFFTLKDIQGSFAGKLTEDGFMVLIYRLMSGTGTRRSRAT